jgi:hypothetical protein
MQIARDRLSEDLSAREYLIAERAMNDALIAIVKNAGFTVQLMTGERVGEILIGEGK